MSLAPVLQTGVALLAAGTPWVVASIVRRRAMSTGVPNAAAPAVLHAIRRLDVATAAISLPLVMLGLRVTPPSLALALASPAAFAVLLYEAWMREEAYGGQAEGGLGADEVRRRDSKVAPIRARA